MKKTLLAIAITGLVAGCSTAQEEPAQPSLESTTEKVSYGMGLVMGERMTNDLPDLQMDQFLQGIQHGHSGDEAQQRLNREEIREALMAYQQQLQEDQQNQMAELAEKNREAGEAHVDMLEALSKDPDNKDIAWRLGIDDDVMDQEFRQTETRNWIKHLVLPTMAERR